MAEQPVSVSVWTNIIVALLQYLYDLNKKNFLLKFKKKKKKEEPPVEGYCPVGPVTAVVV